MIHAGHAPAMWERLTDRLAYAGLPVEPATAIALTRFLKELFKWNRVHNLTAITELEAMIHRHLVDSLALRGFLRDDRVASVPEEPLLKPIFQTCQLARQPRASVRRPTLRLNVAPHHVPAASELLGDAPRPPTEFVKTQHGLQVVRLIHRLPPRPC